MRWASALSHDAESGSAAVDALEQVHDQLAGAPPDLLALFVSNDHADRYGAIAHALCDAHPDAHLIGCSAGGVIGAASEVEGQPALALAAASLPGVDLRPVRIEADDLNDRVDRDTTRSALGIDEAASAMVLLGDPFSPGLEPLIETLDRVAPDVVKIGAAASGATRPRDAALFLDGALHSDGWVGMTLAGRVDLRTIVAQGCRPVGTPMFVTRCQGNVLLELDGRPPLEVLEELVEKADGRERALYQSSLSLGIEMRANLTEYDRGDYLVRNLIGSDAESGSLAVAAPLETNQVVQFVVRDAHTAREDLELHLSRHRDLRGRVRGSLLFSCVGRGNGLYGVRNHDTDLLQERLGTVPVAGFFGNGEIGPVDGKAHLHTYTSVLGLFCEPD